MGSLDGHVRGSRTGTGRAVISILSRRIGVAQLRFCIVLAFAAEAGREAGLGFGPNCQSGRGFRNRAGYGGQKWIATLM
jgi:hypothetical protein